MTDIWVFTSSEEREFNGVRYIQPRHQMLTLDRDEAVETLTDWLGIYDLDPLTSQERARTRKFKNSFSVWRNTALFRIDRVESGHYLYLG